MKVLISITVSLFFSVLTIGSLFASSNNASYHYEIHNLSKYPDSIVTTYNWYATPGDPYSVADNGIYINIPNKTLDFQDNSCAGILDISEVGGSPNTQKLIAVTPNGFFLATPENVNMDDFQVSISNVVGSSIVNILPYESLIHNNLQPQTVPLYKAGSFTLVDNTAGYWQYGQQGIPCKITVLSTNGVLFVGNKNNYTNILGMKDNFTQDYIVTNSDSAAIVQVQELVGVPKTTKYLVITANGVYYASEFNPDLDDFELAQESGTINPVFDIQIYDSIRSGHSLV